MYEKYDSTFLNLVAISYFNGGFSVLMSLAISDLFKTYYGLEPGRIQSLMAYTGLPVAFKLLYGITSDTFPLFGSRRKSYLIILSALEFILICTLSTLGPGTEITAVVILGAMAFCNAFLDVILNSLIIIV